jgi:hypothetical protein
LRRGADNPGTGRWNPVAVFPEDFADRADALEAAGLSE